MSESGSSPTPSTTPVATLEKDTTDNAPAPPPRDSNLTAPEQPSTSRDYDTLPSDDRRRSSYSPRSRSYSRHRSYSRSRSRSYSRSRSPPMYYDRPSSSRHRSSSHHRPLPGRHPYHPYGDTYYGRSRYASRGYSSRRSRSPPPPPPGALHRYRSRSPSRTRPPPYRSNPDCRVYVGNLSYETRWTDLKDFMRKEAGPVVHADIMKSGSNRSLGCGTVEFEFAEDAQRAIRLLNDVEFMGRIIFLREDRTNDARKDAYVAPDNCRLFVDNLPLTASWQDMKDLFRKTGRVLHTDVNTDPVTRRLNGTGLVIFDDPRDARAAIDMFNNYEWQGHRLRVMEEREASSHLASSSSGPPPQSSTSSNGSSAQGNNGTARLPPNPPSSSSSGVSTPSHQPPPPPPLPPQPPIMADVDPREINRPLQVESQPDSYYGGGGGSTFYGEGYYDDRYGQQAPPPPPPPPPPPIGTTPTTMPLPLFPSLISGPGAHLPSHGTNQIFVNKLPFATTSQDLIDLFRHVGPVVRSEILWYNGRPKGTGLVRFEDKLTCERAIGKFNGYLYGGRKLDIRMDKYST